MTPNEKRICARLLKLAADSFSNHGNNDFEIDETHENIRMILKMQKEIDPDWNSVIAHDGIFIVCNFMLMNFFADLLEKEANAEIREGGKSNV